MSEPRIIKKYPNRRLYDTAISSYITLADVKNLVLDGVEFQVLDAKSREDLTRTILLQIISEEEEGGKPIFSSQLLAQLIRSYGGNMQSMLTSYLEKSLDLWAEQQRAFHERTRELMDHSPVNVMTQIAERNLSMWRQMSGLDQWDSFGPKGPREAEPKREDETGSSGQGRGSDRTPGPAADAQASPGPLSEESSEESSEEGSLGGSSKESVKESVKESEKGKRRSRG